LKSIWSDGLKVSKKSELKYHYPKRNNTNFNLKFFQISSPPTPTPISSPPNQYIKKNIVIINKDEVVT